MKKFFLYSGLVLLILVLIAFSISLYLVMTTGARVARARAAIVAAGDRVHLSEYARDPISNEQNAFIYLQQAKGDLEAFSLRYFDISEFDTRHRLRPDQVEALAKWVEQFSQQSQLYQLLEQAAACPDYDERLDYSQHAMLMLPDTSLFRNAVRALEAKALVLAYQNQGDEALRQCDLSLQITAHCQRSAPFLITQLIDNACQATSILAANHVLRVAQTSPAARSQLAATLASRDNHQSAIAALKGERAWGVLIFEQLRSGQATPSEIDDHALAMRYVSHTWLGQAYLNDDEAKYLELMDGYIQAAQLRGEAQQKAIAAMENGATPSGLRHRLTQQTTPALQAFINACNRTDTLNHCLRVLLELDGRPQAALADLGLPDPIIHDAEERPLVIRNSDAGWFVYGVGANGIDDGGVVDVSAGEPPDIGLGPLGEAGSAGVPPASD